MTVWKQSCKSLYWGWKGKSVKATTDLDGRGSDIWECWAERGGGESSSVSSASTLVTVSKSIQSGVTEERASGGFILDLSLRVCQGDSTLAMSHSYFPLFLIYHYFLNPSCLWYSSQAAAGLPACHFQVPTTIKIHLPVNPPRSQWLFQVLRPLPPPGWSIRWNFWLLASA